MCLAEDPAVSLIVSSWNLELPCRPGNWTDGRADVRLELLERLSVRGLAVFENVRRVTDSGEYLRCAGELDRDVLRIE